jgi:hypothetical protein
MTKKHALIPDFLIIGAGKSGTTSLDKYLGQHSQVFMCPRKEPNFFALANRSQQEFINDKQELKFYLSSVTKENEYLDLFINAKPGQKIGETSNTYLYHDSAPDMIAKYNSNMKLIALLRNPVSRLYSRYLHLARDNRLPSTNFADSLNKSSIWWKRNDLIPEGFYFKHLKKYYESFKENQIKIILTEDLKDKPWETLKTIFEFLGVKPDEKLDLSVEYNQSGIVKNSRFNKYFGSNGLLFSFLKTLTPTSFYDYAKNNPQLIKLINDFRNQNLYKPPLDSEIQIKLKEVYYNDMEALQKLIKRDLSHWLNT